MVGLDPVFFFCDNIMVHEKRQEGKTMRHEYRTSPCQSNCNTELQVVFAKVNEW